MQQSDITPTGEQPEDLRRTELSLTALSERIARLSCALGAPLASREDIQKVLDRDLPFFARHPGFAAAGWGQAARVRESRDAEELRALLVMRCDLMLHLLESHGLEDALDLAASVEARLLREGFRPGAEGATLLSHRQRPSALPHH